MRKENEKRETWEMNKSEKSTRTKKNLHVSATQYNEGGTRNLSTPWMLLIMLLPMYTKSFNVQMY